MLWIQSDEASQPPSTPPVSYAAHWAALSLWGLQCVSSLCSRKLWFDFVLCQILVSHEKIVRPPGNWILRYWLSMLLHLRLRINWWAISHEWDSLAHTCTCRTCLGARIAYWRISRGNVRMCDTWCSVSRGSRAVPGCAGLCRAVPACPFEPEPDSGLFVPGLVYSTGTTGMFGQEVGHLQWMPCYSQEWNAQPAGTLYTFVDVGSSHPQSTDFLFVFLYKNVWIVFYYIM